MFRYVIIGIWPGKELSEVKKAITFRVHMGSTVPWFSQRLGPYHGYDKAPQNYLLHDWWRLFNFDQSWWSSPLEHQRATDSFVRIQKTEVFTMPARNRRRGSRGYNVADFILGESPNWSPPFQRNSHPLESLFLWNCNVTLREVHATYFVVYSVRLLFKDWRIFSPWMPWVPHEMRQRRRWLRTFEVGAAAHTLLNGV